MGEEFLPMHIKVAEAAAAANRNSSNNSNKESMREQADCLLTYCR